MKLCTKSAHRKTLPFSIVVMGCLVTECRCRHRVVQSAVTLHNDLREDSHLTPLMWGAAAMLQGEPMGRVLLIGVREENLQRERQKLAHVRLLVLHGPRMPEGQDA